MLTLIPSRLVGAFGPLKSEEAALARSSSEPGIVGIGEIRALDVYFTNREAK